MTLDELIEQLRELAIDSGVPEVWADSASEGYRFKVESAFVKKYSGVTRVILQGD